MATGEAEVNPVVTGELWNPATDQLPDTSQVRPSNTEPVTDEVGIKRAQLLKRMCTLAFVAFLLSAGSVIVGVLTYLNSDSKLPYVIGGGAVAGGMAFLYVVCASYVYFEGKKTKTGTKMTGLYICCLKSLTVWFGFLICGLSITFGISGIWGTVECYRVLKQVELYLSMNPCLEHTNQKFVFSILTMIMSGTLFVLSFWMLCLYTCNTRVFGVRSLRDRRYDFYARIRNETREQAVLDYQMNMNVQYYNQNPQVQSYVVPSAPALIDTDISHGHRREDYSGPTDRAHAAYDHRPEPRPPRDHEQDRSRNPRRSGPRGRPERKQREKVSKREELPPKYEEVVKDDDV